MELFYRKKGSGEPLLILHGLFGSGINWGPLSKSFEEEYEVYLIDQRNHGRSPHDDAFNYRVMAEDLAEFYSDRNIERASIIGHSMGAKTAIQFAITNPSRVDKLVAVDMGIKAYPVQDEDLQKGLLTLDFETITSRSEADTALKTFIPDFGTRQFIMQNFHWRSNGKLGWKMNVEAIIANIEEIGSEIEVENPYQGETLFVKGVDSDYILPEDHASLLASFPNASIEEISNAGHWIHADNPRQFGDVVLGFLNRQ